MKHSENLIGIGLGLSLSLGLSGCLWSERSSGVELESGETDSQNVGVAVQPRIERSAIVPLQAYELCSNNTECGALECVELLGSQVCMATGCSENENVCTAGETCVVSEQAAPDGVCALTGSSDFCGRNCRDYLVCSLSAECVRADCCGESSSTGCPSVCGSIPPLECSIDPRCSAECCES